MEGVNRDDTGLGEFVGDFRYVARRHERAHTPLVLLIVHRK